MARTALFNFSKDFDWKFSGNVGRARKFLMTNFLAADPPMAALLMFPLGKDLMPFVPTDNAEKFCRRSVDMVYALKMTTKYDEYVWDEFNDYFRQMIEKKNEMSGTIVITV